MKDGKGEGMATYGEELPPTGWGRQFPLVVGLHLLRMLVKVKLLPDLFWTEKEGCEIGVGVRIWGVIRDRARAGVGVKSRWTINMIRVF